MRDIRFRALRDDIPNTWVYGYLTRRYNLWPDEYEGKLIDAIITIKDNKISNPLIIKHGTVGQYTGLKDNNGVEKYSGDIERSGMTGAEYEIYWNNEYSGWYKKCLNADKKDIPIYQDSSSSRIIGNIHE